MEKTRYNINPDFSDYEQEQLEKPLSVKQWMLTIIVMAIPLVNNVTLVVLFFALAYVLINLLVDLVMPRLDPRLHLQTGGAK